MDILPVLKIGKLIVLYTPNAAHNESMNLIAELGLRGTVTIMDGGNRYQLYIRRANDNKHVWLCVLPDFDG